MQTHAQDGSVGIRPLQLDDVPAYFEAVRESTAELCRWMVYGPDKPDYSLEGSRSYVSRSVEAWARGECYRFAVCDVNDGTFLGCTWLSQINRIHSFANLGYWVRTSRTQKGVATAGVRLVAGFGLRELGLSRVELVILPENTFSERVAVKAGARREGILRKRATPHGVSQDAVMYSLVREDFDQ